jgi:hypothetical protein
MEWPTTVWQHCFTNIYLVKNSKSTKPVIAFVKYQLPIKFYDSSKMRYRIVIHSLKPPWRQKNNINITILFFPLPKFHPISCNLLPSLISIFVFKAKRFSLVIVSSLLILIISSQLDLHLADVKS